MTETLFAERVETSSFKSGVTIQVLLALAPRRRRLSGPSTARAALSLNGRGLNLVKAAT